jgi:ERCC4-related helicase
MTTLREYQSRIVHEAHGSDSIVVLPTGSGKTLIAAETIRRHLSSCPTSRALFIVPTVLLVNQSTDALKGHMPNVSVASHHGGRAAPYRYSILVSTPAAFSALAEANPLMYGLPTFGVIVFDEVHHVVKSHPYRAIARSLQLTTPELRPKVLGLTASLTYEMGEDAIVIAVQNLFAELGVTKVLTATDDGKIHI